MRRGNSIQNRPLHRPDFTEVGIDDLGGDKRFVVPRGNVDQAASFPVHVGLPGVGDVDHALGSHHRGPRAIREAKTAIHLGDNAVRIDELSGEEDVNTGGAGFLGSHLCEALLKRGDEVLCLDNYFTGTKDNITPLLDNPLFELCRHDVTFPLYVEVDEIYNLACPASPIHYQHDPVQTTKTSVHGAINMLGLAKRLGAKIFQASTSEVYGDPEIHPQVEEYWGKKVGARG